MSLDSDPEISAAFGTGPEPAAPAVVHDDPEINEAFAESIANEGKPKPVTPFLTQLGHMGLDTAGTVARAAGDVAGLYKNIWHTVKGEPTEPMVKTGEAFAAPFAHEPDVEPEPDVKEQIRRAAPKLTDQPAVKAAIESPTGKAIASELRPAAEIAAGVLTLDGLRGAPNLGPSGAPIRDIGEAQQAINAASSGKSMGAASTAANVTEASPELQKAIIETTRKTGGAVNPDVLNRRLEADSLPVKMNLTEGQATQDPSIISTEQNMRGKHPEIAEALNQQNTHLVDNLRAIRESAGPDVFSTNHVEHGDTLIQAYKEKGAAADAQVSANYKALKDAAGGQFPVDANALLDNSTKALHNDLLFDHAPKAVMSTLGRLADQGNMTFENFEALRTNLARIQRSSTDGNERAAAGVIRNQMEALPLAPGASKLKPLADAARASAKAQYSALEADPAYKAAVNDEVPPDKFVQKFITGPSATRDSVAKMKGNLADNDRASQTMGVAAIDHLRDQAKIDAMGNGNFAASPFNKHLDAMRPKLQSLVPPEQSAQLDTLGKVARYTTAQPKGSFVNNSNTLTGALAHGAGSIVEHGVPYGNILMKGGRMITDRNAVKRALDPASGLEKLKESP